MEEVNYLLEVFEVEHGFFADWHCKELETFTTAIGSVLLNRKLKAIRFENCNVINSREFVSGCKLQFARPEAEMGVDQISRSTGIRLPASDHALK